MDYLIVSETESFQHVHKIAARSAYFRKKNIIKIWVFFILSLGMAVNNCSWVDAGEKVYIRVAVILGADDFTLSIRGRFKIYNKEKSKLLFE